MTEETATLRTQIELYQIAIARLQEELDSLAAPQEAEVEEASERQPCSWMEQNCCEVPDPPEDLQAGGYVPTEELNGDCVVFLPEEEARDERIVELRKRLRYLRGPKSDKGKETRQRISKLQGQLTELLDERTKKEPHDTVAGLDYSQAELKVLTALGEEQIEAIRKRLIDASQKRPDDWLKEKAQAPGAFEESLKTGFVKVATFGAEGYQTHLLPGEVRISKELLDQFERELKKILDEVWDVYEEKGAVYDQATPVWHHFAFGLVSFATEVYLKATRFVSLLQGGEATSLGEIDDTLRDVLVYSWYSWAYARLLAKTEE